jgi:hypothetical protein
MSATDGEAGCLPPNDSMVRAMSPAHQDPSAHPRNNGIRGRDLPTSAFETHSAATTNSNPSMPQPPVMEVTAA